MLSVIMLSVIMLSVIIQNVVVPRKTLNDVVMATLMRVGPNITKLFMSVKYKCME